MSAAGLVKVSAVVGTVTHPAGGATQKNFTPAGERNDSTAGRVDPAEARSVQRELRHYRPCGEADQRRWGADRCRLPYADHVLVRPGVRAMGQAGRRGPRPAPVAAAGVPQLAPMDALTKFKLRSLGFLWLKKRHSLAILLGLLVGGVLVGCAMSP